MDYDKLNWILFFFFSTMKEVKEYIFIRLESELFVLKLFMDLETYKMSHFNCPFSSSITFHRTLCIFMRSMEFHLFLLLQIEDPHPSFLRIEILY